MLKEALGTDILGTHSMMAPVVLTVGTTLLHTPSHSFSIFLDKSFQASWELTECFLLPLAWQPRCSFRVKRKTSYLITLHTREGRNCISPGGGRRGLERVWGHKCTGIR